MIDQPEYGGFTFDTFFGGETGAKTFGVIAEFTWGYGSLGGSDTLVPGPTDNFLPDANAIKEINTALSNGGFAGWSATLGYNATKCAPEPSTLVVMTLVGVMAGPYQVLLRRARSRAA
jgi:hypothetical protein